MKNASPGERRLGLQIHAVVFVLTLALLVAINVWTGPPYWVLWVVLGWGVGLVAHGLSLRLSGGGRAGPS